MYRNSTQTNNVSKYTFKDFLHELATYTMLFCLNSFLETMCHFSLLIVIFLYTKSTSFGRSVCVTYTTRFPCLVIVVHVRFTCFTELFTILFLIFTVRKMAAHRLPDGTGG